jgi:anti-sigma factor (TIGR02949 family)
VSFEEGALACVECREHLHAFLDGELAVEAAEAVQRHLEGCSACFERSQLEEAFRHAIRRATPAPAVPAGLESRIRESLDREDARRLEAALPRTTAAGGPGRRPRADWRTWSARALVAAAAVLVAAATISALTPPSVASESELAAIHPAFLRGELVCLDCQMARAERPKSGLDRQLPRAWRPSPDPAEHHRLHLRDEQGRLWELMADEDQASALEFHDNAGRGATVVGTAWPELGVVTIARLDLD